MQNVKSRRTQILRSSYCSVLTQFRTNSYELWWKTDLLLFGFHELYKKNRAFWMQQIGCGNYNSTVLHDEIPKSLEWRSFNVRYRNKKDFPNVSRTDGHNYSYEPESLSIHCRNSVLWRLTNRRSASCKSPRSIAHGIHPTKNTTLIFFDESELHSRWYRYLVIVIWSMVISFKNMHLSSINFLKPWNRIARG